MRRKLLLTGAGMLALMVIVLAGIIISIRSGLQRFSDDAVRQFPGDRAAALIRLVDCDTCSLEDRNHAVWALGQMVEARSIAVLKKHFDGQRCDHTTRLCQYELRKAIRMIETRLERSGPAWRLVAQWHQPWH
jgi:hypothetical protein